jgi:hypothetical protein
MRGFISRLFGSPASAKPSSRTVRLGLDTFEDRVVPASVSFTNGILYVAADAKTNDIVQITAIGAQKDGSTGVKVVTNVTGKLTTQKFGDAANPVATIALDMKGGNDVVDVASLRATMVFVGEGNGNNVISIGDTEAGELIAGSGQNVVSIGGGTANIFTDLNSLPGIVAGSAAYLGWNYQFLNGGQDLETNGYAAGKSHANVIHMATAAGESSIVDVYGDGNNQIIGGAGDDAIYVQGNGNNTIRARAGNDLVSINGNGNNDVHVGVGNNTVNITGGGKNTVWDRGSGSITVIGGGKNTVHARYSSDLTVSLYGPGAHSSVVASLTDGVFVDSTQVTASGVAGNVKVKIV